MPLQLNIVPALRAVKDGKPRMFHWSVQSIKFLTHKLQESLSGFWEKPLPYIVKDSIWGNCWIPPWHLQQSHTSKRCYSTVHARRWKMISLLKRAINYITLKQTAHSEARLLLRNRVQEVHQNSLNSTLWTEYKLLKMRLLYMCSIISAYSSIDWPLLNCDKYCCKNEGRVPNLSIITSACSLTQFSILSC